MSNEEIRWAPACNRERLRVRARLLRTIRDFFEERGVLEVETPLLCRHTVTDPHLSLFESAYAPAGNGAAKQVFFLQTSPEFAMKRLLAAGSGPIYQICKAFRNGEAGRWHNPEFTLLEWYRPGFGLTELTDETEALLLRLIGGCRTLDASERLAYSDVFRRRTGIDPIAADLVEFDRCARRLGYPEASGLCGESRSTWLDFLFSHAVQPGLGKGRISFVHGFPACLPSLARRRDGEPEVVERVEVFLDGVELANGFHELTDTQEQEYRFDVDIAALRKSTGECREKDRRLLAALRAGLPDCSGIALGIDRLLMIITGANRIAEVLAFPIDEA